MEKLMSYSNVLEQGTGSNGVKFEGKLDWLQPSFCHTPNRSESADYLQGNIGSLFVPPTHQENQGRGASS